MSAVFLICASCQRGFTREKKYLQENKKFNYKFYCSNRCVGLSKKSQTELRCENSSCKKAFKRKQSGISLHNFCSRSCAAIVNNTKFPKHAGIKKICKICKKIFVSREKYCSLTCKNKDMIVSKETIVKNIKNFYLKNGRIPLKREFPYPRAARERFGTWNKAVQEAGFDPNPVMFAKKYIAKDGHKCDSLAEKIIDDWLFARAIHHQRSVPYPGKLGLTADFVIGDYWIEFFGLHKQHKRYDELRSRKLQLVKENNLKLIALYPNHLFPQNKLQEILVSLY